MKAMAKLGKAMRAALGPPDAANTTALDNIDLATAPDTDLSNGLSIDAVTGAGALATAAGDPASVTLKAGDSAGALGSWNGTHYSHTNANTKIETRPSCTTTRVRGGAGRLANSGPSTPLQRRPRPTTLRVT